MKSVLALPAQAGHALALILCLLIASPFISNAADRRREQRAAVPAGAPAPQPLRMDPATGLPIPPPPPWIDANWQEPDKVLPQVSFDGLPLAEIARYLREQFKDAFDIIIPSGWMDNAEQPRSVDQGSFTIKLQLKNVRASEIFNAMNIVLEGENNPVRWELKMNGNRPTAVLRYLPDLLPQRAILPTPEPPQRSITFVGDLLGDEKAGGTSIEQLVKTISEVYEMSYGKSKKSNLVQFHKEAQLIVVNGTREQLKFIQETLGALRTKASLDRRANKAMPKAPETNPAIQNSTPQ
jgi:hypothetical protein